MNSTIWILLIFIFLMIWIEREEKKKITAKRIAKIRKQRRLRMNEIIAKFQGKNCLVYTMNSQVSGVITAINEGWIELDNGKDKDAVNIDYIIRIREYPKTKKGKKKAIVLD